MPDFPVRVFVSGLIASMGKFSPMAASLVRLGNIELI